MELWWALPFVGLLLSIATMPLFAPHAWERHFGKVGLAWSVAFIGPSIVAFGPAVTAYELYHTLLAEYFPFIVVLFSLFVLAGGILVTGNFAGTPGTNTMLLGGGTALASVLGTTGASMLLIRTVIRSNANRKHKTHIFVFFIFLVSNIGGALTPLGDPPLFIGFLHGIDFMWTVSAMFMPMIVASSILLALFYFLDLRAWRKERHQPHTATRLSIQILGWRNFGFLLVGLVAVIASGVWLRDVRIPIGLGVDRPLAGLLRDAILLVVTYMSWKTTDPKIRIENAFRWAPIQEVTILFAAIFVTMIPAIAILAAGRSGALAPLVGLVSTSTGSPVNVSYFWLTGLLSSFLDNAPTYLVFFNLAGGDPEVLMGPLAGTLIAISAGAVFMGANTYIGNAPNFMVRSICEEQGIRMPSFFGYCVWSGAILLPLFLLMTVLFFR